MSAHAPSLFDTDSQTPVAAFPGVETGTAGAVPNASGRARATDPETSQAAAESITPVLGTECLLVLATIVEFEAAHPSTRGVTAWQIVRQLDKRGMARQQNCVARRIKDLRDGGYVTDSGETRPGSSGRLLIAWSSTEAGREALR